ncbi:hypothetical protein J0895_23360 [Phormidium pseudopriestleyi FRX01]|uniref:Uncharacterized protein n=1 Tax=Phormidium pseudopriestleyi FRX01 TaxID=1759528 RepID=A0ABS3FXU3_9CYAN|nr:hypothetical protein [Phormidium pseudopriestleyi]MBO0351967.1 hypothetical protein [Phormidium pseudopriestleyi FRX01]
MSPGSNIEATALGFKFSTLTGPEASEATPVLPPSILPKSGFFETAKDEWGFLLIPDNRAASVLYLEAATRRFVGLWRGDRPLLFEIGQSRTRF